MKASFEPNKKIIEAYTKKLKLASDIGEASECKYFIELENNKFNHIITEAIDHIAKPSKKLWELTKWIANNGKDPKIQFVGNASQRWTNIFQKLRYAGFAFENVAIFFSLNDLEKIDEIQL